MLEWRYFEGYWKDSVYHGMGVYEYANGDVYEGEFANGKMSGKGVIKKSN
jgi:hypothetical protein